MYYELNLKKVSKEEKFKMIKSLVNNDMFYECMLICELFKKDIEEKIYDKIIKICKTNQNKENIFEIIKSLA